MSLRTYGRTYDLYGKPTWIEIVTDDNGYDDAVWITTLIQCIKLNLAESPFYANYGIPAQQSVVTQIFPDYYISLLQTYFSPYFASLQVSRVSANEPVYNVDVITHQGAKIQTQIAV